MPYSYIEHQLLDARTALTAADDKASAMGHALRHCMLGLKDLDRVKLGGDAQACVRAIEYTLELTGLSDNDPTDAWIAKAGSFAPDQLERLSAIIEEFHELLVASRSRA